MKGENVQGAGLDGHAQQRAAALLVRLLVQQLVQGAAPSEREAQTVAVPASGPAVSAAGRRPSGRKLRKPYPAWPEVRGGRRRSRRARASPGTPSAAGPGRTQARQSD